MSWMAPGCLISEEDARRRDEGTSAARRPTAIGGKVFYIGIDLAKRKHSASVVRDDGKRLVRGFAFPNSAEGFAALLARLAKAAGVVG